MRSVAKWGVASQFTIADTDGAVYFYSKHFGADPATFVRTITKRSFGAEATLAVCVGFSGF